MPSTRAPLLLFRALNEATPLLAVAKNSTSGGSSQPTTLVAEVAKPACG